MPKILVNTEAIETDTPVRDGDLDRVLVKKVIKSTTDRYTVWHKLGRIPRKAFVVQSTGGFIICKVSLDTTGREQADSEKITLEFNATGTAVVCFE